MRLLIPFELWIKSTSCCLDGRAVGGTSGGTVDCTDSRAVGGTGGGGTVDCTDDRAGADT